MTINIPMLEWSYSVKIAGNDHSVDLQIIQDPSGCLYFQQLVQNEWTEIEPSQLSMSILLQKLVSTLGYKKTPSGRWDVLPNGKHKYLLYYETVRELGPCTSRQVADHLGTTVMEANSFLRYLYGPRKRLITRWEPEGEPGAPYIYDLINREQKQEKETENG